MPLKLDRPEVESLLSFAEISAHFSFLTCKVGRIMQGGSKSGNTGNCVISHLWRAHHTNSSSDILAPL